MKIVYRLIMVAILIAMTTSVAVGDGVNRDALYQVSTLGALQEGVYDGVVTMKELREHGDFGIGTFDGLDGEMVESDGEFYQIRADGKVYRADKAVTTPFAAVTFFETDQRAALKEPMDLKSLQDYVQNLLPTKNIPYAIKISGAFKYIKTRSVPKQSKPYPRLVEVTQNQPTFEMENVKGTILGYWLPQYLAGVNMAGFHLHFLTEDKQAGGHLLASRLVDGVLEMDYIDRVDLTLPKQSDFYKTDLSGDKRKELEAIERSN